MYELIAANKRNSWLLAIVMLAFLCGVGAAIGAAIGAWEFGLAVALMIALVMALVSFFAGGRIVMGISRAREIRKADNPQLFNVVEEMTIAGGLPMPRAFRGPTSAASKRAASPAAKAGRGCSSASRAARWRACWARTRP